MQNARLLARSNGASLLAYYRGQAAAGGQQCSSALPSSCYRSLSHRTPTWQHAQTTRGHTHKLSLTFAAYSHKDRTFHLAPPSFSLHSHSAFISRFPVPRNSCSYGVQFLFISSPSPAAFHRTSIFSLRICVVLWSCVALCIAYGAECIAKVRFSQNNNSTVSVCDLFKSRVTVRTAQGLAIAHRMQKSRPKECARARIWNFDQIESVEERDPCLVVSYSSEERQCWP